MYGKKNNIEKYTKYSGIDESTRTHSHTHERTHTLTSSHTHTRANTLAIVVGISFH